MTRFRPFRISMSEKAVVGEEKGVTLPFGDESFTSLCHDHAILVEACVFFFPMMI